MNQRRAKIPIVSLALLLPLALATLGVGYGLWSKLLVIKGTVETGKVDAKWTLATCAEFHPWPQGGNPGEFEGKDVGKTTPKIDTVDDQILHITVENGYPSYAVSCQVDFMNDGTIPVIIRGNTIVPISKNLANCHLTGISPKTLACDELTVKFIDGIGSQLEPGVWKASSLLVHVEQPAEQNATYQFDVIVCMAQWNEEASAEACMAAAP